jgi:hypothetical protein
MRCNLESIYVKAPNTASRESCLILLFRSHTCVRWVRRSCYLLKTLSHDRSSQFLYFTRYRTGSVSKLHQEEDKDISIPSASKYFEIEIINWSTRGMLFPIIIECSPTVSKIDIAHWTTRTALEVIAFGGLGYSIDSLQDDKDLHPYSTAAKQLQFVLFWLSCIPVTLNTPRTTTVL